MEVIKKTVTTEVVDKVVSCDGKFTRYITDMIPFEKARIDIEEYESKLSVVLWERMIDRGVLHEVSAHGDIPNDKMTPEQKYERFLANTIDTLVDAGCGNYGYFVFKPETEQDIVDLLTYAKTDCDAEDIWFPREEDKDILLSCTRSNLVPGHKYLYCEHCDGYKHLYRLDDFRAKLNKVIDSLEEF